MSTYQLKNHTVEAQRFDVARVDELAKWSGGNKVQSVADVWWIVLGKHTAVPGDYIVKLGDGTFTPLSADQFEAAYTVVGHTEHRDYVLARAHAAADEAVVDSPDVDHNSFEDGFIEGYTEAEATQGSDYSVELGDQRFTSKQWEVIEMYAKGHALSALQEADQVHRAQLQNREFHDVMGIPSAGSPQAIPTSDIPVVIELIREEFEDELIPALHKGDVVEIYDAAIDILYVVYGLLNRAGMNAAPGYDEVQRSNMSKLGEDGKPIIAQENDPDGTFPGRVKKGPNYFKPDLARVLAEQGWEG